METSACFSGSFSSPVIVKWKLWPTAASTYIWLISFNCGKSEIGHKVGGIGCNSPLFPLLIFSQDFRCCFSAQFGPWRHRCFAGFPMRSIWNYSTLINVTPRHGFNYAGCTSPILIIKFYCLCFGLPFSLFSRQCGQRYTTVANLAIFPLDLKNNG